MHGLNSFHLHLAREEDGVGVLYLRLQLKHGCATGLAQQYLYVVICIFLIIPDLHHLSALKIG